MQSGTLIVVIYALGDRVDWEPYPLECRSFKDAKVRR
jgi:hypothetical protein